MITTETTITVNVRIFTNTRKQLDDIKSTIRQDCIRAVQTRKELIEKNGAKDIQIHLMQDSKCPSCGKSFIECKCGKPNRSPAV